MILFFNNETNGIFGRHYYKQLLSWNPSKLPCLYGLTHNCIETQSTSSVPKKPKHHQYTTGTLSCDEHGGPSNEYAQSEMVYWKHIPHDMEYTSPYYSKNSKKKYITFELEPAGWNNIRMALETLLILAHQMGRTLVLPPTQSIYLMNKNNNGQESFFGIEDFFNLAEITENYAGIDIISMEEFLEREALHGNLYNRVNTTVVEFPPNNRTYWDGSSFWEIPQLNLYLRKVGYKSTWRCANECLVAFPKNITKSYKDIQPLQQTMNQLSQSTQPRQTPPSVNASIQDRMYDLTHRNKRRELCFYTPDMQKSNVIHFAPNHPPTRLIIQFYALIFFEDWKHDLWAKRFIRDSIRYNDYFQCAAARVVQAVRERAKENHRILRQKAGFNETTTTQQEDDGVFDTLHIRRGDFQRQYKATIIDIETIYQNSKDELLPHGSTLFIATDDPNRTLLEPFTKRYNVLLLNDFISTLLPGMNPNHYAIVDQLVASRGRVFFGTFYSTYTGYINRMRGYRMFSSSSSFGMVVDAESSSIDVASGGIPSYFHVPKSTKYDMTNYASVVGPYWSREFPMAWRDIDFDL